MKAVWTEPVVDQSLRGAWAVVVGDGHDPDGEAEQIGASFTHRTGAEIAADILADQDGIERLTWERISGK